MAMPRTAVKLLLITVVCLAIASEIAGMASSSRGGSKTRTPRTGRPRGSRNRSPSFLNRLRTGLERLTQTVNDRNERRYAENARRHHARAMGREPSIRSASSSPSFSRSPSSDRNPSSSRSRSRSRSPSLPPEPPFPFPYVIVRMHARSQYDIDVLQTFARMSQSPGDPDMTLNDFNETKNSLIQMVSSDTCSTDRADGNRRCMQALQRLQTIPRDWRGPCGDAFATRCHEWPAQDGWKCSLFMKTSPGVTAPIDGYLHKLKDCANALSPADYQQHLNNMVDSWLNR